MINGLEWEKSTRKRKKVKFFPTISYLPRHETVVEENTSCYLLSLEIASSITCFASSSKFLLVPDRSNRAIVRLSFLM